MAKIKQAKAFLKSARRAATFETASFAMDSSDRVITIKESELTELIRQRTETYRNSWILPYIDCAIDILDGKEVIWTPHP